MINMIREFEEALEGYKIEKLELHKGAIYGFWSDFSLAYLNKAWVDFAKSNNGEPSISNNWKLGVNTYASIPDAFSSFYAAIYNKCTTLFQAQAFYYECSSPEKYRKYSQVVYPLKKKAFLSVHSLIVENGHEAEGRIPGKPDSTAYVDENLILQCCHCRRTKNMQKSGQWDWVPFYLNDASHIISHGFCPSCAGYFRQLDSEGTDYSLILPPFPE